MMYKLFSRLESPRKRVLAERQVDVLKHFLQREQMDPSTAIAETRRLYDDLKNPRKAQLRDLNQLISLGCIKWVEDQSPETLLEINLEWPAQISETRFFELVEQLPTATAHRFLTWGLSTALSWSGRRHWHVPSASVLGRLG